MMCGFTPVIRSKKKRRKDSVRSAALFLLRSFDKPPRIKDNMSLMRLIREDEGDTEGVEFELEMKLTGKEDLLERFKLPKDSIIKLYYDGKLIPWSLVCRCSRFDVVVCRQHQNIKPKISEVPQKDFTIKKKIKELEIRISSLEAVADPAKLSAKADRDLQLLTKQISFLAKRLEEADEAEWVKKP